MASKRIPPIRKYFTEFDKSKDRLEYLDKAVERIHPMSHKEKLTAYRELITDIVSHLNSNLPREKRLIELLLLPEKLADKLLIAFVNGCVEYRDQRHAYIERLLDLVLITDSEVKDADTIPCANIGDSF